jgi:hypothetical protein
MRMVKLRVVFSRSHEVTHFISSQENKHLSPAYIQRHARLYPHVSAVRRASTFGAQTPFLYDHRVPAQTPLY